MTGSSDGLVEVHLLELPVQVWRRLQEHTDELLREFTLMSSEADLHGVDLGVPARLVQLVGTLTKEYSTVGDEQRERLFAAAEAGVEVFPDLVYRVPAQISEGVEALAALLDEADAYCRSGDHLLTLTTPPDQVAFRRWFLGEFAAQVRARPPMSWPAFMAAQEAGQPAATG